MGRDRKVIITEEMYDNICRVATIYEESDDEEWDADQFRELLWMMYQDLNDVLRAYIYGEEK